MNQCEFCQKEINNQYGSGRFCNKKCACAYSTRDKRSEINSIVSDKLKGKPCPHSAGFKEGYDPRRRPFGEADWAKAIEANKIRLEEIYANLSWDDLPEPEKRRRILKEQNDSCLMCHLNEWMGKPLVIEIHHVDGNRENNTRSNLQLLCPNCHSQTDNWCGRKRSSVGNWQTTLIESQ